MHIKELELPGLTLVDSNADYSGTQTIFIDFDGANGVSYDNDALDIHSGNFSIVDSGLSLEKRFQIIADLNSTFTDTGVTFSVTPPDSSPVQSSTIYVGSAGSAIAQLGNFLGLSETIDIGNQIKTDEAFVFTDKMRSTKELSSTIAHEAGHLLGFKHSKANENLSIFSYAEKTTTYTPIAITLQIVNNFSRRTAYYSENYSDDNVWLYSMGTNNTLSYKDTKGQTKTVEDGSGFQLSTVQNGTFTITSKETSNGSKIFAALGATNPFTGTNGPGPFDTNIPYSLMEWTALDTVTTTDTGTKPPTITITNNSNVDVSYEDTFSFPTTLTVSDSKSKVTDKATFILGTTAERVVNALTDVLPAGPVGPANPMPAQGEVGWGPLVPTVSGLAEANRVIGSTKYWFSGTYNNQQEGSIYSYAPSFNDYLGYLQANEKVLFPTDNSIKGWYIDYSGNGGYSFYLSVTGTDGKYGLQIHDIRYNTVGDAQNPSPPWNADPTAWTAVNGTVTIAANGDTFPITVTPAQGNQYTYQATGNWTDITIYSAASLINGNFSSGPVVTGTGDFATGGAYSFLNSSFLASISTCMGTGLLGNIVYMKAITDIKNPPVSTMHWFNELERKEYNTTLFDAGWTAGQEFYDPYWKAMADSTNMEAYLSPFSDRWKNISPDFSLGSDYSITWELGIPRKGKADFLGDGKSDVLFTGFNGTRIGYYADGLPSGWTDLGGVSPGWAVASSADINGNGIDDILFVHENTIGYYADSLPSGWTCLGTFSPGWSVAGCADFNDDGKSDILFVNDTSNLIGYYADGQAAQWNPLGGYSSGWSYANCADFDGNGKSDILFINETSNLMGYFADGQMTQWNPLGGYSSGWAVDDCADFDGNGKSDILFTNSSLNAMGYYADGLPSGWNSLGSYVSGWEVQYCADFDGNGNDDILFANNNSNQVGYYADGLPSGWTQIGGYASGWQVAAI